MVVKLAEDPRRKFIWSEISFFAKWWESADVHKQESMRRSLTFLCGFQFDSLDPICALNTTVLSFFRLILNGQLEMVTGGWVMTDEATAHYFAMIDQLIEGHQWLEKNLGMTWFSS